MIIYLLRTLPFFTILVTTYYRGFKLPIIIIIQDFLLPKRPSWIECLTMTLIKASEPHSIKRWTLDFIQPRVNLFFPRTLSMPFVLQALLVDRRVKLVENTISAMSLWWCHREDLEWSHWQRYMGSSRVFFRSSRSSSDHRTSKPPFKSSYFDFKPPPFKINK
jgi:hypothetical protein